MPILRLTVGFQCLMACKVCIYPALSAKLIRKLKKLKRSLQMPFSPVTSSMIRRVLHTVHLPLTLLVYFMSVHSPCYSQLCTDGIITNQELGWTIYGFPCSFRSFLRWSILIPVLSGVKGITEASRLPLELRLPWVVLLFLFLIFASFTHAIGLSRFGLQMSHDDHN